MFQTIVFSVTIFTTNLWRLRSWKALFFYMIHSYNSYIRWKYCIVVQLGTEVSNNHEFWLVYSWAGKTIFLRILFKIKIGHLMITSSTHYYAFESRVHAYAHVTNGWSIHSPIKGLILLALTVYGSSHTEISQVNLAHIACYCITWKINVLCILAK